MQHVFALFSETYGRQTSQAQIFWHHPVHGHLFVNDAIGEMLLVGVMDQFGVCSVMRRLRCMENDCRVHPTYLSPHSNEKPQMHFECDHLYTVSRKKVDP